MPTVLFTLSAFVLLLPSTASASQVISQEAKAWKISTIGKLWAEREKMLHTPIFRIKIASAPMTTVIVKNETASSSGTLKHRFVWALVMWAITEGKITQNTTVFDSTSGNTGASEAYMCRLIGVPFVAVVSNNLEEQKVSQITQFGGQIEKVDASERNYWAQKLAEDHGGFWINQFGNAAVAEEFHDSGNFPFESSNVFHELDVQLNKTGDPYPDFFIHSSGTGGTISSVGRYITRYMKTTKVVLADSEHSLFYDYVVSNKYWNLSASDPGRPAWVKPGIPGIGYGYNTEPIIFGKTTSLDRAVIDQVYRMPDMATVAAMRILRDAGVDAGASSALNYLVALKKAIEHKNGELEDIPSSQRLSIAIIIGDPGSFYLSSYLDDEWVEEHMKVQGGMKALHCWKSKIDEAIKHGSDFTNQNDC